MCRIGTTHLHSESDLSSVEQIHYTKIQQTLTMFTTSCTVEEPDQTPNEPPYKFLCSSIKAVILSGEASPRGLGLLRTVLSRTFSRLGEDVVYDDMNG